MNKYTTYISVIFFALLLYAVPLSVTYAATLRVSPETGVYTVGGIFTTRVLINTAGAPINAVGNRLHWPIREIEPYGCATAYALHAESRLPTMEICNLWTA